MKKTISILFAFTLLIMQGKAQSVSANPNNGRRLDRLNVKITGVNTNFIAGSNTLQFFRNGTSTNFLKVDGLTAISSTEMNANIFIQASATIGNYSFVVRNPLFANASSTNFFVVRPDTGAAKILSIQPNIIPLGWQNYRVLLTGENTHFFQASNTQITFFKNGTTTNNISASFENIDNNRMVYLIINHENNADAMGFYDIELKNEFETLYLTDALSVRASIGLKEDISNKELVKVYPNPAKENLQIQTSKSTIESVEVYDLAGSLVQTETPETPKQNIEIRLSEMLVSKQIYLLKVRTKTGVYFHKIMLD